MKKNIYYQTTYKRTNFLKEAFLSFFLAISSYPRLLLEVFIRRNFGERYFSFSGALFILVFLAFVPLYAEYGFSLFSSYGYSYHSFRWSSFLGHNLTWYAFLAGFLYMSILRNEEVKRLPSVFDFQRFSLSTGLIHRRFSNFNINGRFFSTRKIEIWLEPAFFFGIGFVLYLLEQNLGILLMMCSVIYSLSYSAVYHQGDHFVMDKIDEMICSEELVASFVDGRNPDETRGFNFYGRRPANPETRRKIAETFVEDEPVVAL